MKERCLEGYPKEFIELVLKVKESMCMEQEEFEALLPSKEIIVEDEKLFRKIWGSGLNLLVGYFGLIKPLSYYYTEDLLRSYIGEKDFDKLPEEPEYRLVSYDDGATCGDLTHGSRIKVPFTKKEFLESTRKFSTQKVKKFDEQ